MNDIDLSSYANWDPIGDLDTGEGFTGTLDGNGYVVKNLTINHPTEDGVGLFTLIGDTNTMSGGEVKNLGLENVNIKGNDIIGSLSGGAAASNILNCYVSGEINASQQAGGLIGVTLNSNIDKIFTNINVLGTGDIIGGLIGINEGNSQITNSSTIGTVKGNSYVGGILGQNYSYGIVNNSYSSCNITTNSGQGGGIIGGCLNTEIDHTYFNGTVMGPNSGGLLGYSVQNSSVKNSIWNLDKIVNGIGFADNTSVESNNKGLTTSEMQDPSNWSGWDTSIWDFSTYPPTFKMYTPTGGGSTGGGTGGTDPSGPNNPDTPGGGDVPIPGAVRLQIGSDSSSTSAIYVDTSFDLGAFDVDFSSADSCAAAIEDIDEVLSRINTKRSEFGAVINRLSSILESQTTTIQNFTSAKSTIMDADIANESADFVKNQILQQTSSALLAQSQNFHASIVLSLIG